MGDIFSSFFGGGFSNGRRADNGPKKGADLRANIDISYEEAFTGVEKEISISRDETCKTCSGSGAKPGTHAETCSVCKGTGQIRQTQNTILGAMQTTRTCSNCNGTGKVIKEPCVDCHGKGTVRKIARVKVKIPAGIDDNQRIVLRGEGEPGSKGGPKGDLYITIRLRKNSIFTRNGDNVYCEIPITFTQATLGAELEIPTILGEKVKYTIKKEHNMVRNLPFAIKALRTSTAITKEI